MQVQDIGVKHLYNALESGIAIKIKIKTERTTVWKVSFIYNNQVICSFEDTKIIYAKIRGFLYLVIYFDVHNIDGRLVYTDLCRQYKLGLLQAVDGSFLSIDYTSVNDGCIKIIATENDLIADRNITVAATKYGLETVMNMLENMGYSYKMGKDTFVLQKNKQMCIEKGRWGDCIVYFK